MYNGYDDSLNDSDTEDEPSPTIRGETEIANSSYPTTIKGQRYAPPAFNYGGLQTKEKHINPNPYMASAFTKYYREPDPFQGEPSLTIDGVLEGDPQPAPYDYEQAPLDKQDQPPTIIDTSPTPSPQPDNSPSWWEQMKAKWRITEAVYKTIFWLIIGLIVLLLLLCIIEKLQCIVGLKRQAFNNKPRL